MSESNGRGLPWAAFIPLLLIMLALIVQAAYQWDRLHAEHDALEAQYTAQQQPLEESQKLRAQLDSLAGATATLAEKGNANAIKLRDYLQKQGITIRPPKEQP